MYNLPKFEFPKIHWPKIKLLIFLKNRIFWLGLLVVFLALLSGFLAGIISSTYFYSELKEKLAKLNIEIPQPKIVPLTSQEEAVIKVVKEVDPAVVSIIVTKDIKVLEEYWFSPFEDWPFQFPGFRERIERREISGGSGFIVSEDGLILTNKHVVIDRRADYTVLTNDGRRFPAKVLARDPVQDLAILKIEGKEPFKKVKLGDSDKLQIGQTVIAIGNVLGEFRNSVSVGVVSGLGRQVVATGGGMFQVLEDVIQTDAAINRGNSGGPLLNLKGEVIGVNTAMVLGAENIGFAIPINKAKKSIEQVKTLGKIAYPFLGVRYVLINEEIQKKNNLPVNYGAWVTRGDYGEPAIFSGSAAEKAGLKEGDIILEFNREKITPENSLAKIIIKYNPGDKVTLKILRGEEEKVITVILGERSDW